ncbi:unnamed protein product, partial [Amoebophrya sp. A25]
IDKKTHRLRVFCNTAGTPFRYVTIQRHALPDEQYLGTNGAGGIAASTTQSPDGTSSQ